jgi:hypothetical protein
MCSPVQMERVHHPKKFDKTESAFNLLWKRHKDKDAVEQVNLLMNDESHSRSQRPRKDPDRVKNCLKPKGINLDEDNKENDPTEPPSCPE